MKVYTYFHNDNEQINISTSPTCVSRTHSLKALLSARYTCGAVTAANGADAWFGIGDCIPLGGNIKEIFVGHCYCVLWETCTGDLHQDALGLVAAMEMCEGPKLLSKFRKTPRFVSCGGQP
jgi:hypothetical protein